jgi:hypothetical protein
LLLSDPFTGNKKNLGPFLSLSVLIVGLFGVGCGFGLLSCVCCG